MSQKRFLSFAMVGFAGLVLSGHTIADEKDIVKRLEEKGAKVTPSKKTLSVSVSECSKWTEADYKILGGLPKVTSLSFGLGFRESSLPLFASLTDLETFTTNGMQVTDQGMKAFTQFPKLQRLTFFHPPKEFNGVGLAQLAALENLEELGVGGSGVFGDDALAAISKIKSLKRLRIWHVMNTNAGVKCLTELPALESLMLGQRLTYTPPACPNDETIALLLEVKTLKSLVLAESRFGHGSLVRLKKLPQLKQLKLDSIDISDADVERLKQDLPNVAITRTSPTGVEVNRIQKLFGAK